jgi:hypothetical protein
MARDSAQAWVRLLLARGYRRDQIVVEERTAFVSCSVDDLPAAAALVRNPHKIDLLRPEILQELRELLLNGRLPHHLLAFPPDSLVYDTDEVDDDCMAVALGQYDEKGA